MEPEKSVYTLVMEKIAHFKEIGACVNPQNVLKSLQYDRPNINAQEVVSVVEDYVWGKWFHCLRTYDWRSLTTEQMINVWEILPH